MTVPILGGRPLLLTPELQDNICGLISKGNYIKTACAASGIDERSYQYWNAQGRRDEAEGLEDTVYVRFLHATKEAEALSQVRLISYVEDAAPKNWIAAITLAERRWPELYGRRDRSVIAVDVESIKSLFTELEENRRKHLVTIREVEPVMLSEATRES